MLNIKTQILLKTKDWIKNSVAWMKLSITEDTRFVLWEIRCLVTCLIKEDVEEIDDWLVLEVMSSC